MKLLPISRDEVALWWWCVRCNKKVTIKERDSTFLGVVNDLKAKYSLKTLEYDKEQWNIVSADWESADGCRTTAKRRQLTKDERFDIISDLQDSLQVRLGIETTLSEYWLD